MRRTSRIALGSAASLSIVGWLLAAGCSSSSTDDNTTKHSTDASDDTTTGDDTVDSSMMMTGDDGPLVDGNPTSGDDDQDTGIADAARDANGELDASLDAHDASDADSGIQDAAADAHDASDAGDADAATPTKVSTRFIGRWDTTGTGVAANTARADWAGSGLEVSFIGKTLTVNLTDTPRTFDPGTGTGTGDYLDIYVTSGGATTFNRISMVVPGALPTGTTPYCTATGCVVTQNLTSAGSSTAPNKVRIFKSTDPSAGTLTLNTMTPYVVDAANNGAIVPAVYSFDHKIEFLGDDQTVGDGDYGVCTTANQGGTAPTPATSDENSSASFVVAKHFNAEHTTIAMSNAGMLVDGEGNTTYLLPALFTQTLPGAAPANMWNVQNYQPDAVVVNIGGISDAYAIAPTTGTASETAANFEAAYANFLETVHMAYPAAYILVTSGPSVGGNDTQAQWATVASAAITQFKAKAGNTNAPISATALDLSTVLGGITFGCDYRPSTADYANIAAAEESALTTALGWVADPQP